ncbi:hypothetical protein PIB30_056962 [Stylosanthes scabra]|uniref:Ubiquitin-like protease family profile domain-containing protein n=1 Tax=Stylosanthes scabra TaxID=79078 RepID=A0ABU6XKT1_9FABA|nr:hypothetical protein [Stylosanthes scabra]
MGKATTCCGYKNNTDLWQLGRELAAAIRGKSIRMFQTYGTNYLDKKTKMPYLVSQLKDQHYLELLDKEKLRRHSYLFAPVLHASHWWLYVLDVHNRKFYVVDSVYGTNTSLIKNKLHRFALRFVDVPKQPNPTDCGVYVMKWMQLIEGAALSAAHTFQLPYNIEEWSQDQLDQFRKDIVAKVIMSMENTLNVEAIKQASNMTMEVSTAELEKKH